MNNFYKNHVIELFTLPFYNIPFNKSLYLWNNFKHIFDELFKVLLHTNNKAEFIKSYYIFIFIYIYYTNFLKYNSSTDFDNKEIYYLINTLNNNEHILIKLIKYSDDDIVKKIIKYLNPFIYNKLKIFFKKNESLCHSKILYYSNKIKSTSHTINNFLSLENNNPKKILSIIIYRYVSSLELNFLSYHDFFIKKNIISSKNEPNNSYKNINFKHFMNTIPTQKKIIDFTTNNFINREIISAISIIDFLLNYYDDFFISSTKFNTINISSQHNTQNNDKNRELIERIITISHKKSHSKIIVKLNSLFCKQYFVEFNIFQSNLSLIHFNNQYINNIDFIKESNFFIQIDVMAQNFSDPSDILDFMHYLCTSFKIINNFPSNISEFICPTHFNSYYYQSFYYFIKFFKDNISSDTFVGKFIIEFVKFIYIYSYYDYFIYYKNDLLQLLISNFDQKNSIFNDFYLNFKHTLKIGSDLTPYPPFCNREDDHNRIIYYTFEIPSYFKLYDFYNAFVDVFDFNNKQNISIYMILSFIDKLKINPLKHNKSNIVSRSQNSYDEVLINESNFVFNTDINPAIL